MRKSKRSKLGRQGGVGEHGTGRRHGRPHLVTRDAGGNTGRISRWRVTLHGLCESKHPEQRLWAAVLVDAVRVVLTTKYRDLWDEAIQWIARCADNEIGSCDWGCTELDLDAASIRHDVASWSLTSRVVRLRDEGLEYIRYPKGVEYSDEHYSE